MERTFALTTDAVFVECEGRIVAANPALVSVFGYGSAEEMIGRPTVDFVPASKKHIVKLRQQRIGQKAETDRLATREGLRRDGSVFRMRGRTSPIEWDGQPAVLGILRPLDEAPETEASLLRASETATRVFASVSLALAQASFDELDETIVRILGEMADAAGVDRSYIIEFSEDGDTVSCTHEWCGDGIATQKAYVQNLRSAAFPWSHTILLGGDSVHVSDLSTLGPEAEPEKTSFAKFDVRSILSVPMMSEGRVRGLVGFNAIHRTAVWPEDVIEQVELVAEAIGAALTRREAALSLARARDEAERANELKDSFLARISHELRTPLNAVLGFSELLLLDEEDGHRQRLLEAVQSSGNTLLSLIDDVLDVTKLRSDETDLALAPTSLADAVAGAVEQNAGLATEAGLDVIVDVVPSDLRVVADASRLQEAISRLLSNSLLYNREGGSVVISHEVPPAEDGRPGSVLLRIVDTGPGMTPDQIERAFEPFDRLGAETSSIPGSGLGLSVTRLLIDAMGGDLRIESVVRSGTTATLRLDLADQLS